MKRYRLTENRLRQIIRESVKGIIAEWDENSPFGKFEESRDVYVLLKRGLPVAVFNTIEDSAEYAAKKILNSGQTAVSDTSEGIQILYNEIMKTAYDFGWGEAYGYSCHPANYYE